MLEFPSAANLSYPEDFPSADDEFQSLLVYPPLVDTGRMCALPGDTVEEAEAMLDILDSQSEAQSIARSAGKALKKAGQFAPLLKELTNIEQAYLIKLDAIENLWHENGKVINKPIADAFIAMRNDAKNQMRMVTQIHPKIYQYLDTTRELIKIKRGGKTYQQLRAEGQLETVIKSAYRPNKFGGAKFIVTGRRIAKVMKTAGALGKIVLAVDVSYDVVQTFNAETKEQQQAALMRVTRKGTEVGLSVAAAYGAGALCVTLGFATGGVGFLACGVVAGMAGGVVAGEAAQLITRKLEPVLVRLP
jgi:hypothetical protein